MEIKPTNPRISLSLSLDIRADTSPTRGWLFRNASPFCDIKSWTAPFDHNVPASSDLNLDTGGNRSGMVRRAANSAQNQQLSFQAEHGCIYELTSKSPGMIGDGFLPP
jgi:hypothetical protein